MRSKEKLNSIESLINEFYHDMKCKGNLNDCANECWKEYQEFCEDIKKDLDKLEKLEKVIEILKNKWIDVGMVIHLIQCDNDTPKYYNDGLQKEYQLTQEEYDLLKEYL